MSEWVDAKTLPAVGQVVIATTKSGRVVAATLQQTASAKGLDWCAACIHEDGWVNGWMWETVTHWMPLPAAPPPPEPRRIAGTLNVRGPGFHVPPNLPGKAWKCEHQYEWWDGVHFILVEVDTPVEGGEDGA